MLKIDWRLERLGLKEPFQLPLILPKNYKDFSKPYLIKSQLIGKSIMVLASFNGAPSHTKSNYLLKVKLKDNKGTSFTATSFNKSFEKYAELKDIFNSEKKVCIYGKLDVFNNTYQLRDIEIVPITSLKKIIPIYHGIEKVISPEKIKDKIEDFYRKGYFNKTTETLFLLHSLESITKKAHLSHLIESIHFPKTIEAGLKAQHQLKRIALSSVIKNRQQKTKNKGPELSINTDVLEQFKNSIPYKLTNEQLNIIDSIAKAVNQGEILNEIISGDVGTGKTICYSLPLAAMAASGFNVGVILPTDTLARQIHENISLLFPMINVNYIEKNKPIGLDVLAENGRINIGTHVVLNSDELFTHSTRCWVVDEEHKFGTEIKEHPCLRNLNYIGATATCIPRTQQLLAMGQFNVHRLKKCHVDKTIVTTIYEAKDSQHLFNQIKQTLGQGHKIIIVYPVAEHTDDHKKKKDLAPRYNSEVTSVESAVKNWERMFPNNVSHLHGKMKSNQKKQEIDNFKAGKTNLLISTTAIEVGFDDHLVYRMVIIHPEVHGLAGLHQLRGRVARNGGIGYCDLFAPAKLSDKTTQRLNSFINESDGFKLAELDLKQRGFGDLASTGKEQSGAMNSFLINHTIDPADVEMHLMENKENKENKNRLNDTKNISPH